MYLSEGIFSLIKKKGPSCSKHHWLNKLVNDKLVNYCSYGIFKYTDIFAAKMCVAAKNINVFAIFQDRNFNVTLTKNFIKFRTTGPRQLIECLSDNRLSNQ